MATRKWTMACSAGILLLFLLANRDAYRGYFQDDDLDTLGWTWTVPPGLYVTTFLTPEQSRNGFRPTGHAFYRIMDEVAGLSFPAWVAAIQAVHLLNGGLLWLLMRQLGVSAGPTAAGVVVFLFHPATFDAYWRPMFVFDLLCGTFSIACVLCYAQRRWVLSFIAFWVACKAKQHGVMLAAVLALYELTLGDRRLLRVVPFAIFSASFSVQALLMNRATPPLYKLHITWRALAKTSQFYFWQMFRNLAAGAALILAPIALRDRRLAFAIPAAAVSFGPLLFLTGRMLPVYVYVSLAFVALQFAMLAERWRWSRIAAPAAVLLLWAPLTYAQLREYRERELAAAEMNRAWVTGVRAFLRKSPQTQNFVMEGRPSVMQPWGAIGALRYFTHSATLRLESADTEEGRKLLTGGDVAVLIWDEQNRALHVEHRRK
jgi:hypothetical protein